VVYDIVLSTLDGNEGDFGECLQPSRFEVETDGVAQPLARQSLQKRIHKHGIMGTNSV
jgi:hypothetical protein